jgi:FkbM family methyltransferase
MNSANTESRPAAIEKSFDGVDYIYKFGEKVIVYYESVEVIQSLYAENIPLFTHSYTPKLGDVVVDIGAGNGYEVQELSRMVGEKGRVIAIEADPNCFRRLQKLVRIANLTNVVCLNYAVSDSVNELFLVDNHPGGVSNFLQAEKSTNSIPVRTVPTRVALDIAGVEKIDFLKLNIEGHEYHALRGLGDFIEKCSHIVISCHDFKENPKMATKDNVIRFLETHHFTWACLNEFSQEWERDYVYAMHPSCLSNVFVESLNASYLMHNNYQISLAIKESENQKIRQELENTSKAYSELWECNLELQKEVSYLKSSLIIREIKNLIQHIKDWRRHTVSQLKISVNNSRHQAKRLIAGHFYRFNRINETYYVGTTRESGRAQLEILKKLGLTPKDRLIEFGCGALNGSQPIFEFLKPNNYVGVDPNSWLRNLRTIKSLRTLMSRIRRKPKFLTNSTFSGPKSDKYSFDYVFAHSVLSHACIEQVELFFANSSLLLKNGGKLVASWRDTEGNSFGSAGSPTKMDSTDISWVYPGVTFFSKTTLVKVATDYNFELQFRPDITEFLINVRSGEYHDWFVATKRIDAQ